MQLPLSPRSIGSILAAGLFVLACPVMGAELPKVRYRCLLIAQGACVESAGICVHDLRPPSDMLSLELDFRRGTANLNGIRGRIAGNIETGAATISWYDLRIFGDSSMLIQTQNRRFFLMLRSGNRFAQFRCRRGW